MTDDAWDGRPENQERDGLYALGHLAIWGGAMWWSSKAKFWIPLGSSATFTPTDLLRCYSGVHYLGPCLTPAEVAAQRLAGWVAGRDAAAAWHDEMAQIAKHGTLHGAFHHRCMQIIKKHEPPADLAAVAQAQRDAVAAERKLRDALRQLDVSDSYAKADRADCRVASTWEIQNAHVREYIAAAIRARGRAGA